MHDAHSPTSYAYLHPHVFFSSFLQSNVFSRTLADAMDMRINAWLRNVFNDSEKGRRVSILLGDFDKAPKNVRYLAVYASADTNGVPEIIKALEHRLQGIRKQCATSDNVASGSTPNEDEVLPFNDLMDIAVALKECSIDAKSAPSSTSPSSSPQVRFILPLHIGYGRHYIEIMKHTLVSLTGFQNYKIG